MTTELEALIEQYPDILTIDAMIPDLNGYIRGKRVPIEDALKIYTSGVQIPESVVLLDFFGESSDPIGRGFSDGDPDGTLRPIRGTTRYVPWGDGKKAQVLMQLEADDGSLCAVDPRAVASRVVDRFNELGYQVKLAFELEFYLFESQLDSRGHPRIPGAENGHRSAGETQVYLLEDLDRYDEFLRKVAHVCSVQSIPASVITSEYSPSQFEINLNHVKDPLQAADHCILLKRAIQGVAADFDMRATFMPKPLIEYSGSGMHIHLSLEDDQGQNVFCGESNLGNSLLRNAIGGLLETIPDVFAIFAPGRNSYRRFVPDLYVPVNKTWGYNNRSVTIRIPSGEDHSDDWNIVSPVRMPILTWCWLHYWRVFITELLMLLIQARRPEPSMSAPTWMTHFLWSGVKHCKSWKNRLLQKPIFRAITSTFTVHLNVMNSVSTNNMCPSRNTCFTFNSNSCIEPSSTYFIVLFCQRVRPYRIPSIH